MMPVISMFYGIIIRMFYFDNQEHHLSPIEYSNQKAVLSIPDENLTEGKFPGNKLKLVIAWVEIHKDEDWILAVEGNTVFKIDALK